MIKKLRIKLILISLLSLAVILSIILSAAALLDYRDIIKDADGVLEILADNDGSFPIGESDDYIDEDSSLRSSGLFSPELPYESRYFSVAFAEDGAVLSVNTDQIAAIDSSDAVEYARTAAGSGKVSGFIDEYRYVITDTDDGNTYIIFLDCGRRLNTFTAFLLTCVGVSVVGLCAVALLLIFFSGQIVKPFLKNREKQKQFITDAGHELKTPLTIIDADADILEMDIGENEWLGDIKNQTKRLSELTNNLILLSRMDERPQTEMIDFPVSDLAEEAIESFQSRAKVQNKTFTSRIQPMLSMFGEEKAIRQLFDILLDNAFKYSDKGGIIQLSLERQKNTIRLCVFNTAESVPKESLPNLFDRFFRAEPSRNSRTGGYGLGLSIASAIVHFHKGKIAAETQDEKSLLITVTFPVRG